ncbi:3-hydroxyisobutyrate dehydrogenase [Chitinophaga niastensis]|uniref:3-hydroxyisobutyrate dehydrogenase n=1 Tax=Chitinophaga niastensis TaxID=536980 RepID=A0A2P8HCD5_CHINA|nr:NAD(P)-dependent oxidoreductase [Chitinophaga niastensis]PSL43897.1 3-hydroxyisobutyrate dehydrogenase [Chitinophaga niastensis]
MESIAVLGLGRMGHGIASCLLARGYHVTVWNRSRAKAASLLQAGAVWSDSPAAAAREASVVIAMLADDAASAAVWLGAAGALENMQPGSFVIECSTISAVHVTKLAATAKEHDLIYIDCPVTGLPEAAAAGNLTLLVGADPVDLERIRPVLTSMSAVIRHFGPVGTGTAYKLLINLMGAVQIAALAEGLALAESLGLDRETVITAIENSAAASPQVVRYTRRMAERNFAEQPAFTTSLRHKDAAYGVALATSAGSPALLGEVATSWFAAASVIKPDQDEAAVLNVMKQPS